MKQSWTDLNNRLLSKAIAQKTPINASFELTNRCNLQCKMCYVCEKPNNKDSMSRELSAAEWIRIAEQARDAGVLYVTLTGGEVFLRSDFFEIYEAMSEMGLCIQIYSNGTMLTPEIIDRLFKTPPVRISMTVYGSSPDTYERVCGVRDGYERVLRNIELLHQKGLSFDIKTTAIKANWREFEEIAELAKKYKVKFALSNYVSPRREGSNSDPLGTRLSPQELIDYEKLIQEYNKKNISNRVNIVNDEIEEPKEQLFESEDQLLEIETKEETAVDDNSAFSCMAGRCGFWISWDGRMIACGLLSEPVTYPLEQGFMNAWEELKSKCLTVPHCEECTSCDLKKYCYTCPGRLKNENGTFDRKAAYLCEHAQLLKEAIAAGTFR